MSKLEVGRGTWRGLPLPFPEERGSFSKGPLQRRSEDNQERMTIHYLITDLGDMSPLRRTGLLLEGLVDGVGWLGMGGLSLDLPFSLPLGSLLDRPVLGLFRLVPFFLARELVSEDGSLARHRVIDQWRGISQLRELGSGHLPKRIVEGLALQFTKFGNIGANVVASGITLFRLGGGIEDLQPD